MTIRRFALPVLLVLLALPVPQAGASVDWTGEATLISGTSRYDAGEWIYTDFVYDDYGADTVPAGQPNVVSLAPTVGDFRYPNGTTITGNAADIVEVRARLAADADDLEIRVLLESIVSPSTPALRVEANGITSIVTSSNATIDASANTITFTLDGIAAGGRPVKLNIGAGLNDGSGGLRAGVPGYAHAFPAEFTTGAPTDARLFDLAFNTHALEGRGGAWNEAVQAASLATGNLAPFTQTVDVDALATGTTTPVPTGSGYYVRLFRSRQSLGEGMASTFPQYRGAWQPYAIWIPSSYTPETETPLFLNMHSLSVHHNQYRGGAAPSASYKTFYEQFEAKLGAIVITPLGRGPDGWYEDQGLVDTLEVWADTIANYAIDPDRTYVGGYSMGGYGTYRLSTLMPDTFASAVSIVGPPANGIWAYPAPPTGGENNPDNTRPQLENTRHVPFWITQGVLDELVPVAGIVHQTQRFRELGHEYRFALHPAADHLSFVFQDDWSREASWFAAHPVRVTAPRHVTFKVRPSSWATAGDATILAHLEALLPKVGARVDGAYWVGDVEVAPGTDVTGAIDLLSGGIARAQTGIEQIATVGTDGPSPHVLTGLNQTWATAPTSGWLSGSLSRVTSLTIDVGRAGLPDAPDVSGVTSSVPATITFVRNGVEVGTAQVG